LIEELCAVRCRGGRVVVYRAHCYTRSSSRHVVADEFMTWNNLFLARQRRLRSTSRRMTARRHCFTPLPHAVCRWFGFCSSAAPVCTNVALSSFGSTVRRLTLSRVTNRLSWQPLGSAAPTYFAVYCRYRLQRFLIH